MKFSDRDDKFGAKPYRSRTGERGGLYHTRNLCHVSAVQEGHRRMHEQGQRQRSLLELCEVDHQSRDRHIDKARQLDGEQDAIISKGSSKGWDTGEAVGTVEKGKGEDWLSYGAWSSSKDKSLTERVRLPQHRTTVTGETSM